MAQPLMLTELKADVNKKCLDAPRDGHKQILANDERRQLAGWMLASADGQAPKDRAAVTAKVEEMLPARHASNTRRQWGGGSIKLSHQEVAVVHSSEPRLSKTFFERFYTWCRAHGIKIEEGVERSQDAKRAAKMTEVTVERHFHDEFGLEAELISSRDHGLLPSCDPGASCGTVRDQTVDF